MSDTCEEFSTSDNLTLKEISKKNNNKNQRQNSDNISDSIEGITTSGDMTLIEMLKRINAKIEEHIAVNMEIYLMKAEKESK